VSSVSSDAALALAVFCLYLALMLWGLFETFWPTKPPIAGPPNGTRARRECAIRIRIIETDDGTSREKHSV
jgi:hypothetical protein